MTTVDGNHVAYGSGAYYAAQIVYTLTYPSDTQARIDWERRVYYSGSLYDSSNSAGGSGDLGGTDSYGAKSYSDASSGTKSYETGTKYVTRVYGSTVTVTDQFWVKNLADGSGGGAQSTANASIAVAARPYTVPTAPGTPAISAISTATATSTWADPSNWGGDDTSDFKVQIDTDPGFGTATEYAVNGANSKAFTGLSANTVYYVRARGTNTAGDGAWSATQSFTTSPNVPAAPTGVSAARVSDAQATVTWTRNVTSDAPYTSQQDQRRKNGGSWSTIATVSSTATSYSDTTLTTNGKWEYRVVAINSSGSTTSGTSSAIYTTPSVPTGASAAKDASGNIVITWTNTCAYSEYQTEVWESQNGGAYALLTTKTAGTTSHTHTAPSTSVTHQYQVRHKTSSGTALYSGYSTTSVVTLASAPAAPTGLAASPSPADYNTDGGPTFSWTHNSTDSSPQSNYQGRVRKQGDVTWQTGVKTASGTSSAALASIVAASGAVNGDTLEWQVSTWGQDTGLQSPWSATATVLFTSRPTATVNTPVDLSTIVLSTLDVAWTYYQAEAVAQAAWRVTLLDASANVLEVKSGADASTSTTMATALDNATDYTVRVEVQSANGLWSLADEVTITTAFLPPATVTIATECDATWGRMVIAFTPDATNPGVTVDPVSVAIQRRIDGGDWVTIANGLDPSSVIIDPICASVGLNEYRAIVTSALPSSVTTAPVSASANETVWAFVNFGDGFAEVARLRGNPQLSPEFGIAKAVYGFAGRTRGVQFTGEALLDAYDVAGTLDLSEQGSTPADFKAATQAATIAYLRWPSGLRIPVTLSNVKAPQATSAVADVAFTATQVDYVG